MFSCFKSSAFQRSVGYNGNTSEVDKERFFLPEFLKSTILQENSSVYVTYYVQAILELFGWAVLHYAHF